MLLHVGEPLEPPLRAPARGPPTNWAEHVQVHDDHDAIEASPDAMPETGIHAR